ncbi:MAG: DUF4239 domain-containing protein [Candidatus Eremiobacteraeota bacterium]|nr:DUF4239 domain-containing protein [Candidatus Eremiobacteraeota bacterium]
MTWLFQVPWWLSMILITGGCATLACCGHVLVRRSFPKTDFIEHNEVAGFIVAVVGVLYAVLLGFLTVIVWQQYAEAEDRSSQEVDAATDIWRFVPHLQQPDKSRIASDLKSYVDAVLFDEWPKMRSGKSSAQAQSSIIRLFGDVSMMRTSTLGEANLQNHMLERVQLVGDLRRRRIHSNNSAMPPVVWTGIFVGALALMSFIYLFGLANFRAQLVMTAVTAIMIGLCLTIVMELDFPYRGDVSISPERWIVLHGYMRPR